MKVVYKPTIIDEILAAGKIARADNREIDRIELSAGEWREFVAGIEAYCWLHSGDTYRDFLDGKALFAGIKIVRKL